MKYDNSDSPNDWRDVMALSLVISIAAIILAGFALKIPFSDVTCEVAYNKALTLAGLIIGTLGVAATVYFVVMGITIYKYINRFRNIEEGYKAIEEDYKAMKDNLAANRKMQHNGVLDTMSALEGISNDKKQTETIRLMVGRMICKSETHSTEYPLTLGIMYLGQYSRSQEDIDILEKIIAETDDERIKVGATKAIEQIGVNKKQAEDETKTSQLNLRWWRNRLGLIRN